MAVDLPALRLLLADLAPYRGTWSVEQAALEHLERGARRGGRGLDDLEVIWAVRTGTAATTLEAQCQARPIAVHWGILRWGAHWLKDAGLDLPAFEVPDAVWKIYPDLSHAANWEEAIAATALRRADYADGCDGCHETVSDGVPDLCGAAAGGGGLS